MNKILYTLLLFGVGCSTQPRNSVYYQAYDGRWDDPTINPIFDTEREAKEYAHRNTMGGLSAKDDSHSYIVREINYRYEIRQVNDSMDEVLHTTNSKRDGLKYVEQFMSAHSDLFMYDLRSGNVIATSTP
jgi:hypothetical protein|tara:strand:- start:260 stop:649 length:390 start_codon:yes stop_codon:yes gene_type:complete